MADNKTMDEGRNSASDAVNAARSHVVVLMDESGSMGFLREQVVNATNEFLHDFRESGNEVRATIATFDKAPGRDRTRFIRDARPIAGIDDISIDDYKPQGMTPLHDAVLDTILRIDETVQDDEVVFLAIITDGGENASETTAETLKNAVARAEDKGWTLVFLGANQDAQAAAQSMGMGKFGQSYNFAASASGLSGAMKTNSSLGILRTRQGPGGQGMAAYDAQVADFAASEGTDADENTADKLKAFLGEKDPDSPAPDDDAK